MTSRTPTLQKYSNFDKEPKENTNENSNIIDYNGTNTNKAGINQSSAGGNNTNTTTIENRPVNKGYRNVPTENHGALFDIEYIYPPFTKKKEIKKEADANDRTLGDNTSGNRKDSALERSEKDNKDKTKADETKNSYLKEDRQEGPDTTMAYEGRRVDQLEMRNKQHSAKIHELERELRNVKMENSKIRGQYVEQDGPYSNNGLTDRGFERIPERHEGRGSYESDPRYPEVGDLPPDQAEGGPPGRPQYKNEQHRVAHRHGGADKEPYWGLNRYYNPQYVTAYRTQNIPYYAQVEQKEKQEQPAGGIYIIRFEDSGYNEVIVALRQLQTILRSNLGYILGVARKHHVYPIEGDPDWWFSKQQYHRHPRIQLPYRNVEEAIAVFWFPTKEKAKAFFDNSFHNRFKDHNFPTTRSFEGHYIPLLTPPILKELNTYLVIELLDAKKRYYPEALQKFQATTSEAMLNFTNNCFPFVASAIEGREGFKPGPMFHDRSKVFISRFDSMVELSELWMRKIVQNQLSDCGLSGPRNVWAFSLQDWEE